MAEPIVFISHSRVRERKLDGFRRYFREHLPLLEAGKPRTLVMAAYLNEDGTEVTIVHTFADAESMDLHMEGVQERAAAASEFLESARFDVLGRPSDRTLEMLRTAAASGVELNVRSEVLGAFLRPASP
jgi:hypothetical protein